MKIFDHLSEIGVIPVIAIDDADRALDLADALAEGGLPIAEITFRTEAASEAIARIAKSRANFLVGAGTVFYADQIRAAYDAGARFALAPGTDQDVIEAANKIGLPYAPGVATPTDIQKAVRNGCRFLKLFPSEILGGPKMLANISAPFKHLNLRFNPTGGVRAETMDAWFREPNVKAVGGSWIATREDIANGNCDKITQKANDAVQRAQNTLRAIDV